MKKEDMCIRDSEPIKAAASMILGNFARCVVVVNEKGRVKGVFSEGDVLRAIVEGTDLYVPLKSIMKPSFHYLHEKDLKQAYGLVQKFGITMVPIVDNNFMLRDVVTLFDILPHLIFQEKGGI